MKFLLFIIILVLFNNIIAQNYGLEWIGRYNGSHTTTIASDGSSYNDKTAYIEITRKGNDEIHFKLHCWITVTSVTAIGTGNDAWGIFYQSTVNISSYNHIDFEQLSGNKKIHYDIYRNGSNIYGTMESKKQLTSGDYEYLGKTDFNVNLDVNKNYKVGGYVRTSTSNGAQRISDVEIEGFSNGCYTDSEGKYEGIVLYGWSGEIIPRKTGYTFAPPSDYIGVITENKFQNNFTAIPDVTSVEEIIYFTYSLKQNYPNPFNPTTRISYSIQTKTNVIVKIYDVIGKEIKTLVSAKKLPGNYNIEFDANDLSSGIYFYRLVTEEFTATKKMLLLR